MGGSTADAAARQPVIDARPAVRQRWWARRRCPACGSTDVRRSGLRSRESGAHPWRSPYRCRACATRFWVTSRKARASVLVATGLGFLAVLLVAFGVVLPHYRVAQSVRIDAEERVIEEWSAPVIPDKAILSPPPS